MEPARRMAQRFFNVIELQDWGLYKIRKLKNRKAAEEKKRV
jgi:hypothetical protein